MSWIIGSICLFWDVVVTCDTLICGLCKSGGWREVEILMLCKERSVDIAEYVFHIMKQHNVVPNLVTYNIEWIGAKRRRSSHFLFQYSDEWVLQRGKSRFSSCYFWFKRIGTKCDNIQYPHLGLLDDAIDLSHVGQASFIVQASLKTGEYDDATKFLEEMTENGFSLEAQWKTMLSECFKLWI